MTGLRLPVPQNRNIIIFERLLLPVISTPQRSNKKMKHTSMDWTKRRHLSFHQKKVIAPSCLGCEGEIGRSCCTKDRRRLRSRKDAPHVVRCSTKVKGLWCYYSRFRRDGFDFQIFPSSSSKRIDCRFPGLDRREHRLMSPTSVSDGSELIAIAGCFQGCVSLSSDHPLAQCRGPVGLFPSPSQSAGHQLPREESISNTVPSLA
jgi:hypothetical protein